MEHRSYDAAQKEECVKGMGLIEVYKMIQHEKEAIIEVNKIQRYTE